MRRAALLRAVTRATLVPNQAALARRFGVTRATVSRDVALVAEALRRRIALARATRATRAQALARAQLAAVEALRRG